MATGQTSNLEAGATAGAAFGPWGAVIGGAAGAAVDIAQSSKPSGPSAAEMYNDSRMSNSGWVVSTGSSKASGSSSPIDSGMTPSKTSASGYGLVDSGGGGAVLGGMNWTTIAIIAGFAVLLLVLKK